MSASTRKGCSARSAKHGVAATGTERVESGYALNEPLQASRGGALMKIAKSTGRLDMLRLGDAIKAEAAARLALPALAAQEDLQRQQCPQRVPVVAAAGAMVGEHALEGVSVEMLAHPGVGAPRVPST